MPRSVKFRPLSVHLLSLPPEQRELRITFAELEAMAKGPLPRGAWTSAYWSNSTVSRKNWERYGFTAKLERHACTVVFRRVPSAVPLPLPRPQLVSDFV